MKSILNMLVYQNSLNQIKNNPNYIVFEDFARDGRNKYRAVHIQSEEGKKIIAERKRAEREASIPQIERALEIVINLDKDEVTKVEVRSALASSGLSSQEDYEKLIGLLIEEEIELI